MYIRKGIYSIEDVLSKVLPLYTLSNYLLSDSGGNFIAGVKFDREIQVNDEIIFKGNRLLVESVYNGNVLVTKMIGDVVIAKEEKWWKK